MHIEKPTRSFKFEIIDPFLAVFKPLTDKLGNIANAYLDM